MRGSLEGAGGVVFVELFSEFSGGGATGEIYTGAPDIPNRQAGSPSPGTPTWEVMSAAA